MVHPPNISVVRQVPNFPEMGGRRGLVGERKRWGHGGDAKRSNITRGRYMEEERTFLTRELEKVGFGVAGAWKRRHGCLPFLVPELRQGHHPNYYDTALSKL